MENTTTKTTAATEENFDDYRPTTQAQDDSDARFYAMIEALPEGDNDGADLYDPRDNFDEFADQRARRR